jgi:predicted DNA-binding transcriptional regulator AlpA
MSSTLDNLPPDLAKKRVLTSREAAQFRGVSLREWMRRRAAGKTPPAVRLGVKKLGWTIESLLQDIAETTEQTAA